jgi:PAS domain S-box-containing protein
MRILARLVLLVCLAVAPAVAIQAYNEFDLRRQREVEIRGQAERLARLAASEIDRIVHATRLLLGSIAANPAVAAGDVAGCTAHVEEIERRFPEYARVAVADASGRPFCYSPVTAPGALPNLLDRPYFQEALGTDDFVLGQYVQGRVSTRAVLPMALRVRGPDGKVSVAIAALDLEWLSRHLERRSVPEGGSVTVAGRDGVIVARTPSPERFIGTAIPQAFRHLLRAERGGSIEVTSQDGTRRVLGYVPLGESQTGLYVSAGVSTEDAYAAIDAATRRGLTLICLGFAAAVAAAAAGGHAFLRRPVRLMQAAARRWGEGDYAARVPRLDPRTELDDLARAFNEMAEAVQNRDAALRETERRLLRREKDFSAFLIQGSTDAILGYDPEGRVTVWNPALAEAAGRPAEEAVGRPFLEMFPSARGGEVERAMRAALGGEARAVPSGPYPAGFARDGSVEAQHFPLKDETGEVIGGIAFLRDTTERERAERRDRQARKLEALGRLTGGVAHDFNNLLQALSGCLRMIRRRSAEPAVAPLVEAGQQAVDRGAKLTQQLLAFARRQALRPEALDVRERLLGMSELLARALSADIRLDLDFAPDLWPVEVDPTQFELAVLNLAVNARDAMPGGGRLSVASRNASVPPGSEAGGTAGDFVLLTVSDTGTGMPPEVIARAFDPFFTTKEIGKGSGLGLSQVYGFASQSGGWVQIESVPGEGTRVSLWLPRSTALPSPARPEPTAPEPAPGAARRLLFVEDDEAVAEMTAAALEDFGYAVARASSADEAIARLRAGEGVDLLLSDIVMPGSMNGADLAREARRLRPALPVLLTTGYADRLDVEGAFPVLAKPYRIETLLDAVAAELADPRRRAVEGGAEDAAEGVGEDVAGSAA